MWITAGAVEASAKFFVDAESVDWLDGQLLRVTRAVLVT